MFSVEPWEVESDQADFLEVQTVELAERWELVLLRDLARKTLCFRRVGGPLSMDKQRFKKRGPLPASERMKLRFIECLETNCWKRELFLNREFALRKPFEPTAYSISLACGGSGWIQRNYREIPFQCRIQDVSRGSGEQLMKLLEDEEDFRFARRFVSLSLEEIWGEVWLWKRGNLQELQRVLTWAFRAQSETDNLILRVDLLDEGQQGRFLFTELRNAISNDMIYPLMPAIQEAVEAVLSWFAPHINTPNVQAHSCLRQLVKPGIWVIKTQPQTLSAHERIEAAIQWREWLAGHGKSA